MSRETDLLKSKIEMLLKNIKQLTDEEFWFLESGEMNVLLEKSLYLTEHITLKIREMYSVDYTPTSVDTKERLEDITIENVNIQFKIHSLDNIEINIPTVLNKKFDNKYMLNSLSLVLAKQIKNPLMLENRVVVFEYEYEENTNNQTIDYDNTELRLILNSLTKYILLDDSPDHYDMYCCCTKGQNKKTNIYILSQKEYDQMRERRKDICQRKT